VNAVGSSPGASTTFTPGPAPPVITTATAGNGQVSLSWTAASGTPTGYSVTSNPVVTPPAGCTNITALTCVFTGLTNGTSYTFVVTATFAGGTIPSAPSTAVTPLANFGSVTQTITVTKPQGALVIGEKCSGNTDGPFPDKPYLGSPTPENCAVDLGTAKFQPGGFYEADGNVSDVEVRDQRDTDVGWHVDASLTPFTSGTNSFPACNFGFAPAASGEGSLPPYVQHTTAGAAVGAACPAGGYSTSHTVASATAGGGLGDSLINGAIAVQIPLSAPSGAYSAVLTFTLLTN
jgi:Fibronectin type III domain